MPKNQEEIDELIEKLFKKGYTESDKSVLEDHIKYLERFEREHGGVRIHLDGPEGGIDIYKDGTVVGPKGIGQTGCTGITWYDDPKERMIGREKAGLE